MPLYAAFRSNAEFGQPYSYGILSQRQWVVLGVGVWFRHVIVTRKVDISTIESSFLFLSWASLLVFSLIALTFDPTQLDGDENFAAMTVGRGLRFHFQTFFISFGSLYYFIKYSKNKKLPDLLILLLFLSYIVFIVQGRTYMIFLAATFFFYSYFNSSHTRFVINSIKVLVFLFVSFVLLQMFMPDYVTMMRDMFSQMFTVLGGGESNDASSNSRIWTSLTVLNHFDENPLSIWLGTGRVSHQWNDGYEGLYGYFFPEDIGLLGGVFLYGIFGMILLLIIPLLLEIKEIKLAKNVDNIFIITVKYMLIFSILRSVQGGLYFGANAWIVLFFILYAYNQQNRKSYARY